MTIYDQLQHVLGSDTRGVIRFRRGRFTGEVNAPSVEDAIVIAKGLASLLKA
jgi:hypothetical protein